MTKSIKQIYDKLVTNFDDSTTNLPNDERLELISEFTAHLDCIRECIDDEEEND